MKYLARPTTCCDGKRAITINDHGNLLISLDPDLPLSAIEVICNRLNNLFWCIDRDAKNGPVTDDSGIDVGDTTSGNVHVSVFHGEQRASIIIDPDHATRVAERLWDCAATGRAVQIENQPQDSIP